MSGSNGPAAPEGDHDRPALVGRRGGLWIGGAAVLSALGSLLAQLAFERALGVEGFASWAYLMALLGLFVPLACLGANHLVLSEHFAGRLVKRAQVLHMLGYFAACSALAGAAFVVAFLSGQSAPTLATVLLGLLLMLTQVPVNLVYPVLQARAQGAWVALWPLVQVLLRAAVGAAALWLGWRFLESLVAWLLVSVALAAVSFWQVHRSLRARLRLNADAPSQAPRLLQAGLGFGLSDLLDSLDLKLLVPLAAFLYGSIETAAAGLSVVLLSAIFFFPHVLITRILLPEIHRSAEQGRSDVVRRLVLRLSGGALILLLPLSGLIYFFGYPAIALVVKGDYSSQAAALSCLAWCIAPLCVSQLVAAPHLGRRTTWRLLRWRVESLAVFAAVVLLLQGSGLASLIIGFAVGRIWLGGRAFQALWQAEGDR